MNESLTLSLGQTLFHAERPAYDRLKAYLDAVAKVLAGTDGDEEILLEVEHSMAELFQAILGEAHRALTLQEVVQVCDQMGDPSAFGDESGAEQDHTDRPKIKKQLFRDTEQGFVGGVAVGLAHRFSLDPVIVRLLFVLALFAGFGALAYILLWLVTPAARSASDRVQMRGRPVTLDNIKRSVQVELNRVENSVQSWSFGRAARNLLGGLGRVLKRLFGVLAKVLGWVVVVYGILLLVVLIAALLAVATGNGTVWVDGMNLAPKGLPVSAWLNLFFPKSVSPTVSLISATMLLLVPLHVFVWFGVRLAGYQPNPSTKNTRLSVFAGFGTLWFMSLAYAGFSVASIASDFAQHANWEEVVRFTLEEGAQLSLHDAEVASTMGEWHKEDGRIHAPIVAFDLVASEDSLAEWRCVHSAQGLTQRTAYHRAKRARVQVEHTPSEVVMWDHLSFPETDGYRGQHARVTLAIPKFTPITVSENLAMALGPLWSERFTESKLWMATDTGFVATSLPVQGAL